MAALVLVQARLPGTFIICLQLFLQGLLVEKVNSQAFFVHSAYIFFLLFETSSVYATALQGFFLSLALVDGDI